MCTYECRLLPGVLSASRQNAIIMCLCTYRPSANDKIRESGYNRTPVGFHMVGSSISMCLCVWGVGGGGGNQLVGGGGVMAILK